MADYNELYNQMRESADDMSQASVEMKGMMTADDTTDINIDGYGLKPSFSKQLKNLTKPVMDTVSAWFSATQSAWNAWYASITSAWGAWFADAQTRFASFIASSGFDEVGDYYDGTLTIQDYNQVIRYKGEAWKLNFATPIPYTTVGNTDETWESTDKAHFNFLGEDVLRQNLGSSEGLKYIGRCPSVAVLRTIEPSDIGQRINVVSYSTGWAVETGAPVGGGEFYYDKNDTTSADDDIYIFVTPNGARWKRSASNKTIKAEWKGLRPGDDATPVLNSIGNYLKARAKAAGTVANLPRVTIDAGLYYLSDTITLHDAFKLKSRGYVTFQTADTWDMTITKPIINIENDADIPNRPSDLVWASNDPYLNGNDGSIDIRGPRTSLLNKCRGISVGNTVAGRRAIRGGGAWGFSIRQCGDALHLRMITTYLLSFKNFNMGDNSVNLTIPTQTAIDSGERISFSHGVMGSPLKENVYMAMSPGLFFDHVSFDFTATDVFLLDGSAQYGMISLTNCHWEAFGGYFVRSLTGSRIRIFITNCNGMPTQPGTKTAETSQTPSRPMFFMNGSTIVINGLSLYQGYRPLTHENFLIVANPDSAIAAGLMKVTVNGLSSGDNAYTPCPIRSSVLNPGWDMSGETVGNTITNRTTYSTKNMIPAQEGGISGWSSGLSGKIVALSDGTKALQLTATQSGSYAYLQTADLIPVQAGRNYLSYYSVQKLAATGTLGWGLAYCWYNKDGVLLKYETVLSGAFGSVYDDTTLPGYNSDATANGNRKISTTFGFGTAPAGAAYCRPVAVLSAFMGVINVINHVMWEAQ